MSLLQCLPYKDYKLALQFSAEQCEKIARLAELNSIAFSNANKPGEILMRALDRCGCTVERYKELISSFQPRTTFSSYKPNTKVAILIANEKYLYLSKLATPSVDCNMVAEKLKNLGFIIFMIRNTKSEDLKEILKNIFNVIPENSYCFTFYAGHGCQLCNTKCMLGINCPNEDIKIDHCVTENYVLNQMERCKLDLCVFIMDMCRIYLDRTIHPQIYQSISTIEDYSVHQNLIITYSAQSSQSAYEVLQAKEKNTLVVMYCHQPSTGEILKLIRGLEIECSTSIDNDVTYELKTGDTDRIVPGTSVYVNALCLRIEDDRPVSDMIDLVHRDVENTIKKQRPLKVQCGTDKRSLYDPAIGDTDDLRSRLKEISETFKDNCDSY